MKTLPKSSSRTPLLSACMIVKNEEKVLATCLRSIRDHVDEIVIVDTGSGDRTVAIAESFGAKVYHHPWENHFSRHRNQSFDYASGDWLFVIDADEELPPESGIRLRKVLPADPDIDAVGLLVECPFGADAAIAAANSLRLFRNRRGLHYAGRVHNYIVGVKKALCTTLRLLHHGYALDRATRLRRFKRTTELLKLDIADDPRNPRPRHFLAASYLSENMLAEALREAQQAVALFESAGVSDHNYLWSLYIAASACFDLDQTDQAEILARKGLRANPDHLDSHYLSALIAYRRREHAGFLLHLDRCRQIISRIENEPALFGEMVHNTFAMQWRLHLYNAFLLLDGPDPGRFQDEWEKARARCPDLGLFHRQSGNAYLERRDFDAAQEQYLHALEQGPAETQILWILSHIAEKRKDLPGRIQWLEKLLARDPGFPHAGFQLALAHLQAGHYQKSLDLFTELGLREPANRLIRINRALCLRGLGKYAESIECCAGIQTADPAELSALTGNLAYCHYALGRRPAALACFLKWSELQPGSLEPVVYLARLYLEQKEFEACVVQCDRLLTLLGMNRGQILNSLADLGALFHSAGRHPSLAQRPDLVQVCEEIGFLLSRAPAAE